MQSLEFQRLEAKAEAILKLLQGCNSHRKLLKIHCHVITTGLHLHSPAVSSALLRFSAVSVSGRLAHALRLFRHQIPLPTADDWNSLIRGFSRSSFPMRAIFLYNEMAAISRPDSYTLSFVLGACERLGSPAKCTEVHAAAIRRGLEDDVLVRTNLVRCYAGTGTVGVARKVFDEMPHRDLVAWNVMISGYARAGSHREALGLYGRMREDGVGPDAFTLVALLSSCADAAALADGAEIHRIAREEGFFPGSVFVGNALVDMYSKCGSLDSALGVFKGMPRRDVSTWNSMIVGLGSHGRGREAIELFERMRSTAEIEPNPITFLGLLTALSRQGLVQKGTEYFNLMTRNYGIVPGVKHYGCLVDLFGRAGELKKALEVIKDCPFGEKDPVLWRTLLGACKVHRSVEIGEIAMRNLVRLGAFGVGDCILLANIYRGVNNVSGVARMREMIKNRGVKIGPGWSWIEMTNRTVDQRRSQKFI